MSIPKLGARLDEITEQRQQSRPQIEYESDCVSQDPSVVVVAVAVESPASSLINLIRLRVQLGQQNFFPKSRSCLQHVHRSQPVKQSVSQPSTEPVAMLPMHGDVVVLLLLLLDEMPSYLVANT